MIKLNYQLDDFSAAHRLVKGYQGPCAHLHGHTYRVAVTLESAELKEFDMLVDFADIKAVCNRWVQDNLDHGTLVCSLDTELLTFVKNNQQQHYVFPDEQNTTAECLSRVIFDKLQAEIQQNPAFAHAKLTAVTVHESTRASACYSS